MPNELYQKCRCDMCGTKLSKYEKINKLTTRTPPDYYPMAGDGVYWICEGCATLLQGRLKHRC